MPRPISRCEHRGYAFQRLKYDYETEGHAHTHVRAVADLSNPKLYPAAYCRWTRFVESLGDAAVVRRATTASPLAIGLGNVSPIEVGCTLHHTYGVPFLPGTALKGLARRAATDLGIDPEGEQAEMLFGSGADKPEVSAAYPVYWDAWLVANAQTRPLQQDVITVHHQEYYGSRGEKPATDFDSPNPVPFLTVKPGTEFLLVISCASSGEWATHAADVVAHGLTSLGAGAKTNAGYGLFTIT